MCVFLYLISQRIQMYSVHERDVTTIHMSPTCVLISQRIQMYSAHERDVTTIHMSPLCACSYIYKCILHMNVMSPLYTCLHYVCVLISQRIQMYSAHERDVTTINMSPLCVCSYISENTNVFCTNVFCT